MRVFFAAIFVFGGMLATVALLSSTGAMERLPQPALAAVSTLVLSALLLTALWVFNRKPTNILGLKSPEEHLQELQAAGMVETTEFVAARAFEVEEAEDEGLHYFLSLENGGVLYLTGQSLYDYAEVTDDPEFNQPRRFPCTEFAVVRHKVDRYILDIRCGGRVIEPERVGPPFSREAWRKHRIPEDGEIIRDRSYEALLAEFCPAKSPVA